MSAKTLFSDVRASQLELAAPVQVSPKTPLSQAVDEMKKGKGGCALVCDGNRLRGIFTERDLLNRVLGKEVNPEMPIEQFMTAEPLTLPEDVFLVHIVDLMDQHGFRHITLIGHTGEVKGIVSAADVISYLAEHFPAEVYNLPPRLDQKSQTSEGG